MAKSPKVGNLSSYSLQTTTIPGADDRNTSFSSKKVINRADSAGERRAPDFSLERMKTTGNK